MNNAIYCRWSRIRCTSSCSYRIDNIHYEQWQTLIFTISHNYSMCIIQKREIKIKTSHLAHSSMGGEKQSKLTSSTNLNLLHLIFLLCILFYQNEIIRWTASLPRSLIILVTTDNVMIQCRGHVRHCRSMNRDEFYVSSQDTANSSFIESKTQSHKLISNTVNRTITPIRVSQTSVDN